MLIMFARKNRHDLEKLKKSLEIMLNQMDENLIKYVKIYDTKVVYAVHLVEVENPDLTDCLLNNTVVDIIDKKEYEKIFNQ